MNPTTRLPSSDHQTYDEGLVPTGSKRPAPRGTAAYPRRRGNTACQVCRARRTKCDNSVPSCSFCLKTGATCIRTPVDMSSFDPASLQILERIEDLNQQVRMWREEQTAKPFSSVQVSSIRSQLGRSNTSRSWLFPPSAEDVLPQSTLRLHLLAILRPSNEALIGSLSSNSPLSSFADLETQSVNTLVDQFFEFVHVKNPVLDEYTVKGLATRLVLQGVDWSAESCLILIVCALGTLAVPFDSVSTVGPESSTYSKAQTFFLAAQKRLGSCLVENGLIQAQCLFLAGVYLMTVFKPLQAWRMFSQSLACCQDFTFLTETNSADYGIHDTAWSSRMVSEQAVYWAAWKSEQEVRTDLRPPDFCSQESIQVEFPKFFPVPPAPADTDTARHVKAWTFYLAEIALRRQSLSLAADIAETVGDLSIDELDKLAQMLPNRIAQVQEWRLAIPEPMSLEIPVEHDDVCKFVLRGHLLNLIEMLHWPFLSAFIEAQDEEPATSEWLKSQGLVKYGNLKSLAEKALFYHAEHIRSDKPGFVHRHHGTWFLIRGCSRGATMLLKAAIHNHNMIDLDHCLSLPDDWRDIVNQVIELHQYWAAEIPDAAFRLNALEALLQQAGE